MTRTKTKLKILSSFAHKSCLWQCLMKMMLICFSYSFWITGFSQVWSWYQEGFGGSSGADVTREARPVQSWAEPLEEKQKRPVEVEQNAHDGQKKTWGCIELGNSVRVCSFDIAYKYAFIHSMLVVQIDAMKPWTT